MPLTYFQSEGHPQQRKHRDNLSLFPMTEEEIAPEVDDRALPHAEFSVLYSRYQFTIDVAASDENAKLPRYYTVKEDGLSKSWAGERVYCNPPYSHIEPWVKKATTEHDAPLIVMLLPANRTEQGWWQTYIEPYRDVGGILRTRFLPNRIRFIRKGMKEIGPNERPPFGCVLCVWDRT